jgi:3',5'-cyclic AMP phosphodiesterase CpdA
MDELHAERRPYHIVIYGDATALGFPAEVARAAAALHVGDRSLPPALAVPGNHDYYTRPVAASGCFEKHFAPWQQGERVGPDVYPFAQRAGPLWLVGVNSCRGNSWPSDASGCVGAEQLERLRRLLAGLSEGPRILVTHYPVCRPDGSPERISHGLCDLPDLMDVARKGGVCLWLHGHQHHAYHINNAGVAPFPVICVGSSTQRGRWAYHEYSVHGLNLKAVRRIFDPERGAFRDGETFEISLRNAAAHQPEASARDDVFPR